MLLCVYTKIKSNEKVDNFMENIFKNSIRFNSNLLKNSTLALHVPITGDCREDSMVDNFSFLVSLAVKQFWNLF